MRARLFLLRLSSILLWAATLPVFAQAHVPRWGTGGSVTGATTANLNLYVDVAGNDNNDCLTALTPCLTSAGVVARIPKVIRHNVEINYGLGTFRGPLLAGFTFDPSLAAGAGTWIRINGTMVTFTPASGSATGAASSFTKGVWGDGTTNNIVKTGAGWTVGDFKGKLLTFTSGNYNGNSYPIVTNTADTIYFTDSPSNNAAGGDTFVIQDWGTSLFGGTPAFKTPSKYRDTSSTANVYAVQIWGSGMSYAENWSVRNIKLTKTGGGFYGLYLLNGASASVQNVWCDIGINCVLNKGSSTVAILDSVLQGNTNSQIVSIDDSNFGQNNGGKATVASRGNFVLGLTAGSQKGYYVVGDKVSIQSVGDYLLDLQRGFWTGSGAITVQKAYFKNLAFALTATLGDGFPNGGQGYFDQTYFDTITTAGLACNGVKFTIDHSGGTGVVTGMLVNRSCIVNITANTSFGTVSGTDISFDTSTAALADVRSASPTVLKDAKWGSMVVQ